MNVTVQKHVCVQGGPSLVLMFLSFPHWGRCVEKVSKVGDINIKLTVIQHLKHCCRGILNFNLFSWYLPDSWQCEEAKLRHISKTLNNL